jgi:CRISPR-associated protein Cas2
MLKTCRKYIQWVQNSVFEGEISVANYERMMYELQKIIVKEDGDSIIVYKFRTQKYTERKVYGTDKKQEITFI